MDSSNDWLSRLASRLGPPSRVQALGTNAWRLMLDGRSLVAKVGPGVADEADGLCRLALVPASPPVPEVVLVDADLLVTTWVDQGPRSRGHEEDLGRGLAALHTAAHTGWGGGSAWIGGCRVDPSQTPTAAAFYGTRISDLGRRCGLEAPVERVVRRLDELLPLGPPSLVHGDLWWSNVLWGSDGRAWLIDPSVHGGHPEEDLAMLALFGTVPQRLLDAYREVNDLGEGWQERVALFQLYPLLAHAVLFGGHYRAEAAAIANQVAA